MRKFSLLIQLRFIYVYLLFYFIAGYFYDSHLKEKGVYIFIENYFGVMSFFLLFILLVNTYSFFIKCKRKKMVFDIRMKFFILMVLSILLLFIMRRLELPFEKKVADIKIIEKFVSISLYKYKLGLFLTFSVSWLFSKVQFCYLYILAYLTIIIAFFFIAAKKIRTTITRAIFLRRERKRRAIEMKLIQEQIELQEMIEKRAREFEKRDKEGTENDISI